MIKINRYIVKIFTKILKEKIQKTKNLYYLDFFDNLLENNGLLLKKEYELDGTHLSPRYISLLVDSLKKYN